MPTDTITTQVLPQYTGNHVLTNIRHDYIRAHNIPEFDIPQLDTESDILSAMVYEDSVHDPITPVLRKSYDALIGHLVSQYSTLTRAGYKFIAVPREDYDIANMLAMLTVHKTLTYARQQEPLSHIMMQPTALFDDSKNPLVAKDVFNCVQKAFAYSVGYDFSFQGDKGAWLIHRSTVPKSAHLALWNESRGKHSWAYAGSHARCSDGQGFYQLTSDPVPYQSRKSSNDKIVMAPRTFI